VPRAALGAPAHWRSPRPAPKCSPITDAARRKAEAVVAQIRKVGSRADAIAADLAAPDGPYKLAEQIRAIVGDRLDILVANAGSKAATIEETTVEDFDKLFAVNVRAPFLVVQQLLPILSKGSSIVFVSYA
jgi:3-oxoacyl-[acyl-carrier protein] reductase